MNRWSAPLLLLLAADNTPSNNAFVPTGLSSRRTPFLLKPLHSYLDSLSNNDRSSDVTIQEPPQRFESYTDSLSPPLPSPPSFDEEDLQQQKNSFVDVNDEQQEQVLPAAVQVPIVESESAVVEEVQPTMDIQEEFPVAIDQTAIEVEVKAISSPVLDNSFNTAGNVDVPSYYFTEITGGATTPDVLLSDADEASIPTFSKEEEEEAVASAIDSTIASSLSSSISRSYLASRLSLQESKNKNEKRMSRSVYEIEKTEEAIEKIKLRAQEEIQRAETELENKLADIQSNLDSEIERITSLLLSQIEFENERETSLINLIWTLQSAKLSREEDIGADEKTTAEMIELRNKMDDSTISSQLDVVIAQKQALAAINICQVDDLNGILDEAQSIVRETRALITLLELTLNRVVPLTAGDKVFEFSDLEKLQSVWKDASDVIDKTELRMQALKERYDNDRLNKLVLLGEPVPSSLQKVATKIEVEMKEENFLDSDESSETTIISSPQKINASASQIIPSSNNINSPTLDLSAKNEKELVGLLAMSVGKAAIASAKAGVFGIKAVLETISDEEVTGFTEEAIKKSAGITKVSSGLTESMKSVNSMKSKDDLKNVVNSDLKSGIESTGETLNAFGKAGQTIVNKVTSASSASHASDALKETSDDLIQAFNAVTALSMKSLKQNPDKRTD